MQNKQPCHLLTSYSEVYEFGLENRMFINVSNFLLVFLRRRIAKEKFKQIKESGNYQHLKKNGYLQF